MCCSTLLGFVAGVLIIKVLRRVFFWRGGGGCGGRRMHGCGGHPYGAGWGRNYSYGADARSWDARGENRRDAYGQATPPRSSGRSVDDLARALELHERQRTEAEPVLSLIKEWLGSRGARADAALATLVPERFDAGPLLRQIDDVPPGPRNALVEGLEHLHTILISEQRDALRAALRLDPGAASPSASSPGTDKPSGDAS